MMKKILNVKTKYYILIAALFLTGIYWTYIPNGFIWLDHIDLEYQNALLSPSEFLSAFTSNYSLTTFYRPILSIVHSTDYFFYGNNPYGYHITNILIHIFVTVLTFIVIKKYIKTTNLKALASALFIGIHPINFLTVGAISYRTDSLALLFILLAAYFFIGFIENDKKINVILSVVFCLAGFFSKETAIFWVLTAVSLLVITYRNSFNRKKIILLSISYGAALAVYFLLRLTTISNFWMIEQKEISFSTRVLMGIESTTKLLLYLPFPSTPLISDVARIQKGFSYYHGIFILFLGSVLWALFKYRNNKRVSFCLGLFTLSIFPAMNILPLPRFISPHYLYFSTFCMALLIALVLESGFFNRHKKLIVSIGVIWLIVATYNTSNNGRRFKNDYTLFHYEVKESPHFREGHYYLGEFYMMENKLDLAEKEFTASLHKEKNTLSYVDESAARINLAAVYLAKNRPEKTEQLLIEEKQKHPKRNNPILMYNIATSQYAQRKYQEVIITLSSQNLKKEYPMEAELLLADSYIKIGEYMKAKEILDGAYPRINTSKQKELYETILKQISIN